MKQILLFFAAALQVVFLFAQGSESFTNIPSATSSSYSARTWTGDNGLPWNATDARTDQVITGAAILVRNGAVTCSSIPNGISTLSFKHQQFFTGSSPVLEVRINGNLIGTASPTTSVQTATFSGINISGSFSLEIKQVTAGLRIAVDDITWTSNNTTPCTTPTAQPTALSFSAITNTSITGSFTAASPTAHEYLVLQSTSNSLTATPLNGNIYYEGDVLGNATVVYRNSGTAFTSSSLPSGSTFYYYIFSLNSACVGGPLYYTVSPLSASTTTTAPPVCAAPTAAPTAIILNASSTTINGNFTASSSADGYLVVRNPSATFSFTPANNTAYTPGQTVGGTGVVVKYGSGTTFSTNGLTISTPYYFFVYSINGFTCSGGPLYFTTALTGNTTTTTSSTGEPAGYYSTVSGKSCADLKTTLKTIITTGNNLNTYADLWNQYLISDIKPREVGTGSASVIWDIYSDKPAAPDPYNFTPGTGQCGNYSGEGQCYNREHSFPQNWFTSGTNVGPGTDYIHIYPTDGKVNGERSNYIYGEVATATFTSLNGSKLGSSSVAGITGPVFEPIDEYKGDLARTFLYMVTRYEDNMPVWGNLSGSMALQALEPNTFPSIDVPYLKLMIKWSNQDPVSQKEIDRNNAAYAYQGNRNPYVDHPEYVAQVWNATCPGLVALPVNLIYFTGKLAGERILLNWEVENEINFARYDVERSFNGSSYTTIGSVEARGSRAYSFTDDANAIKGRRIYYRLKKTDKDGSFTYSDVFSIHIPLNVTFTVYPNPAADYIRLQVNNSATATAQVTITDLAGKLLISQSYQLNNGLIQVNTSSLKSGTYLVKMLANGEQYLQKVMIAK